MHTAGEERAMSAMNHSDLSNRVDYIREIIEYAVEFMGDSPSDEEIVAGTAFLSKPE